jgi:hypothetical protein
MLKILNIVQFFNNRTWRLIQSNHSIGSNGNIEIWISTEITASDEYAKGIL